MSKWKTKTKRRLKSFSAIALAVVLAAGNFSGMNVKAEAEEGITTDTQDVVLEPEYEIDFSKYDVIIDEDDINANTQITISKQGYRLSAEEEFKPFKDLFIGRDVFYMTLYNPIVIDGVPEGSTISLSYVEIDCQEGSALIINDDCTLNMKCFPTYLWAKGGSAIEVRNGATLTFTGSGNIHVEQDTDVAPAVSGNGDGILRTDDFMGHFELNCGGATFADFANIDLNLELYPGSEYIRRGEFEISQLSEEPVFMNCGNVSIEASCFPWDSESTGAWIDASGDVKIIDNGSGLDISGYYTSKDEPLIKAKNFMFYSDFGGISTGLYWDDERLQNVAICAEESICIEGGAVSIKGQLVAPEIKMKDIDYLQTNVMDASSFEGNVQITNAECASFQTKMTNPNAKVIPIFAGNASIQTNEYVTFEGPCLDEADYFAKNKDIHYGDGYLSVKSVSDNGCSLERLEGNKTIALREEKNYDHNEKFVMGPNSTLTTTEVTEYDQTSRSYIWFGVADGEKLSDVFTMSDGARIVNQGNVLISVEQLEQVDMLVDLHPNSTRYARISARVNDDYKTYWGIYTTDIAWDKGNPKKATWKYISTDNNRASEVKLYKDGVLCQLDGADYITVTDNEIDFTSYIEKEGYGNYTFTVKPVITEADEIAVSFETTSDAYKYQEETSGGNSGDENGGNTGDENGGNTGDENGGNTGDENGGNTGDENGGNTGDNNGGNTGDENGGTTGGNNSGTTGDNNGNNTGSNTGAGNNTGSGTETGNNNGNESPDVDTDGEEEEEEVEEGDELEYEDAIYVVTKVGKNPTVSYQESLDSKAKKIKIPSTIKVDGVTYKVTGIEDNAFSGNKKITEVTIGNNVKTIGESAFSGCKKLKTVKLGSALTTIDDEAFYKCTSLTSITIPSNVSKIGSKAFYGCKKLKNITIKTKKLTNKKVGKRAFQGIVKKATIKVPSSKLNSYKKLLVSKGVSKKAKIKK